MKKILITGSSGYIGSHLLKKLKKKFEIFCLDKNESTVKIGEFHRVDIRDIRSLQSFRDTYAVSLGEEYDTVIHLAAEVAVGASTKDPILYYETNVLGTLNVLRSIKTKNFIFASTGAAEGLASPYGLSKKAGEEVVKQFCEQNSIDYTTFRFYNVIGSDGIEIKNTDGLFYNLLKSKKTGTFKIFGNDYNTTDGTCIRDYVHVYEVCEAIIKAIDEPSFSIECLGHGNGHSVLEIVNKFIDVNKIEIKIDFAERREGDIEYSVLKDVSPYMKKIYRIEDLLKS
jgi:UDP-glucose 4-epimerase